MYFCVRKRDTCLNIIVSFFILLLFKHLLYNAHREDASQPYLHVSAAAAAAAAAAEGAAASAAARAADAAAAAQAAALEQQQQASGFFCCSRSRSI